MLVFSPARLLNTECWHDKILLKSKLLRREEKQFLNITEITDYIETSLSGAPLQPPSVPDIPAGRWTDNIKICKHQQHQHINPARVPARWGPDQPNFLPC